MPVNETATLEHELREEIGVAVDRVYMNALYPERFSEEEAAKMQEASDADDGAVVGSALRAAISEQRRATSQRDQLERLRERVGTGADAAVHIRARAGRRRLAAAGRGLG